MSKEKQKAAALTATPKNNRQTKRYHNALIKSSGKIYQRAALQLGELLLFLHSPFLSHRERSQGWQLFEVSLKRYAKLRFEGVQ